MQYLRVISYANTGLGWWHGVAVTHCVGSTKLL